MWNNSNLCYRAHIACILYMIINFLQEEEFAGSPIACLDPIEGKWSIVGVSNWRIACTKAGMGRPRMYDKISSNIEWIKKTIGAIV